VTKIDQNFEQKFWDLDNTLIAFFQYLHASNKKSTCRRAMGYLVAVWAYIFQIVFCLELWMVLVLVLSMYQ
jgi:hypothetical protein